MSTRLHCIAPQKTRQFYPEDGGSSVLRNVGNYHTTRCHILEVKKRHPSKALSSETSINHGVTAQKTINYLLFLDHDIQNSPFLHGTPVSALETVLGQIHFIPLITEEYMPYMGPISVAQPRLGVQMRHVQWTSGAWVGPTPHQVFSD